ncbi:hypothetical protein MHY87_05080 [Microvirga sp. ACRRW]|uniref:ADYC domain-containing protein n=1 Tax=Microvirga sp. ACRRW TaxID=2918205 RepID=UPI001EF6E65F|nr:ADYC domain-containing protein [Microvirga sp. ACRRW]MCG7392273.1 hypothetical protein [Microvirga sp. ACRRW]
MRLRFYGIVVCALSALCMSSAAFALSGRLEVTGGEFKLRLDDGRVLEKNALVGHRIVLNNGAHEQPVLIDAVMEELSRDGQGIVLYRLLIEDPATKTLHNICQADARGRQLGFPMPRQGGFDLTCTSGAEGKCILMGYRPWDERSDVPMRALHRACIHAIRADYGGDSRPSTRDGTLIDIYDRHGIREAEKESPMPFEAAWGENGALCVTRPRIAGNVTLDELAARYPRLAGNVGAENCTEETMQRNPQALLFNRSASAGP